MEPDDTGVDAEFAHMWPEPHDRGHEPQAQPSAGRLNAADLTGANPEYTGYREPWFVRVRTLPTAAASVIPVHPMLAARYRANHCPRCNGPLGGGGP
jgi:hypothetical protein